VEDRALLYKIGLFCGRFGSSVEERADWWKEGCLVEDRVFLWRDGALLWKMGLFCGKWGFLVERWGLFYGEKQGLFVEIRARLWKLGLFCGEIVTFSDPRGR